MKYIISLGTNLGDRYKNLQQSALLIAEFAIVIKRSSIYETKALTPDGAPRAWDKNFYNAALYISVSPKVSAHQLLLKLQGVERKMGRPKTYQLWAPRIMDIDIIVGPKAISSDNLIIPHPQFSVRDFVLIPANEVAPNLGVPGTNCALKDFANHQSSHNIIRKISWQN